ncbi:hypothetical protein I3F58_25060 [Streptomyces sp. MUM 203J]|uniref:hypothetical protein n=1 Tax=Streptomyces sp. MUM 203J TaxID=2791990 RepID=UPI001F047EB3|nr:hypothetical protein [Streptomyces sp. MUM 203J]MCH0542771.1 hypothetical protein [Streptomyces sp. MUM 203J]
MAEPDFSARGVRIERWPRSLTRAGEIRIEDGRLALLTSYGREIDSAPVGRVRVGRRWFAAPGATIAKLNGARYRLTPGRNGRARARTLAEALRKARGNRD